MDGPEAFLSKKTQATINALRLQYSKLMFTSEQVIGWAVYYGSYIRIAFFTI